MEWSDSWCADWKYERVPVGGRQEQHSRDRSVASRDRRPIMPNQRYRNQQMKWLCTCEYASPSLESKCLSDVSMPWCLNKCMTRISCCLDLTSLDILIVFRLPSRFSRGSAAYAYALGQFFRRGSEAQVASAPSDIRQSCSSNRK